MFSPTLVHEYLSRSASRFPDKIALVCGEERWTYRALDQYSDYLAHVLGEIGVHKGDRVIVFLDNSSETVISLYGILKAGAVFVILNSAIKSRKLKYILRDSGARLLITHTRKARTVIEAEEALSENTHIIWVGNPSDIPKRQSARSLSWNSIFQNFDPASDLAENGKGDSMRASLIDLDIAALIYTSGSSGEPKGVISGHCNMVAAARSIIQYLENISDDIVLNVLPLSFDYGLYQVIMAFMFSGTVVMEKSFLYPVKFLECIEKERVTGLPIVPTMAAMLLKMGNLDAYDLRSLRYISNTAAALPVEHIRKIKDLFPHARLFSMYGLTECKRVSYLPPEELDRRASSVGKAMPNCEISVVDGEGKEVAPGEVGELVIRGANVMQGYWNAPELTARIFRQGRRPGETLLYSGDYFKKDSDGFLYFIGRKDDMIKTRGERVSAREVENVLCEMDGIAEAAVLGVPDDILGQVIKAFVVPGQKRSLAEQDVRRYCMRCLEPFMVPKYLVIVEELPKTPHGKVDKKSLEKWTNKMESP
jgi:long-chain acyl-CoA synthetase